jgi:hypothetical protein
MWCAKFTPALRCNRSHLCSLFVYSIRLGKSFAAARRIRRLIQHGYLSRSLQDAAILAPNNFPLLTRHNGVMSPCPLLFSLFIFLLFRRAGIAAGLLSPCLPSRPPPLGAPHQAPAGARLPALFASLQPAHIKTIILCLHRRQSGESVGRESLGKRKRGKPKFG